MNIQPNNNNTSNNTVKTIHSLIILATVGIIAACQTTHTGKENRFDQADTNHDGRLSRDEVSDMIVTEIFNGRDVNRNGKLTKAEWVVPGDEQGNKVFRNADANHDGVVTLEEAKVYGRKIGVGKAFFNEADKNHDGYLSREEASAYYASKEGPAR